MLLSKLVWGWGALSFVPHTVPSSCSPCEVWQTGNVFHRLETVALAACSLDLVVTGLTGCWNRPQPCWGTALKPYRWLGNRLKALQMAWNRPKALQMARELPQSPKGGLEAASKPYRWLGSRLTALPMAWKSRLTAWAREVGS